MPPPNSNTPNIRNTITPKQAHTPYMMKYTIPKLREQKGIVTYLKME